MTKLAAESAFCCEFNNSGYRPHTQAKRAKARMTGENSQQKSFSEQMSTMNLAPLHLVTASRISGQFDSQCRQIGRRGIMTSKGCDRLFHGDSSFLMGNYFSFPLGMGLHPPFGKLFGTGGTTATNLDQI